MKSIAIVHAGSSMHSCMLGETLDYNTIARLERGIEALDNREVEYLGIVAGYGSKIREVSYGVEEREGPSRINIGHEMIIHLARHGVPARYIRADLRGKDTVGEVVFGRHTILQPARYRDFLAITNSWHRPRVKAIYDHILGDDYRVDVIPVFTAWDEDPALAINLEAEAKRLAVFKEQFCTTRRGDFAAIVERMYQEHALYKDTPMNERITVDAQVS